jgi:hypothetical protein
MYCQTTTQVAFSKPPAFIVEKVEPENEKDEMKWDRLDELR